MTMNSEMKPDLPKESLGLSILLTALTSMGVLSVTLYVPSMLAIADDLNVDKSSIQITLSLFLLGFSTGQLVYGPLSDQFGRRPILLSGLILYAASSVFCALSTDVQWLQLARLCQGVGACCGAVVARAVVRDVFAPANAIKAFAFIATALSLAPAIAPIIGGQLQVYFGWRADFYFLSAIGFVMFIWVLFGLKESNFDRVKGATHPARLGKIYWQILTNGRFVGLVLVGSLLFCGLMSYTTMSPFLMLEELKLSPDEYGMLIMFTAMSYGMGSFLSGRFVAKLGISFIMISGPLIAIFGAACMLYFSDELTILGLVIPVSIFVFGNGLVIPPTMASAMAPFGKIAGSASAMVGAFQMGLAGLASSFVHHLYDGSARPLAEVMLGLAICSLISYLLVRALDKKQAVIKAAV